MKGNRGERLSSQFREEIYNIISTNVRNKNPELSAIVSVTEVDVAPDLKTARVYVSIYDGDGDRRRNSFEVLCAASGHIRYALSKVLRLRTIPELKFILDNSMEYGEKIDRLLKNIGGEGDTANDK